ncbi:MAG: heparinase II/III family protein [Pseudomonadota bacterium]
MFSDRLRLAQLVVLRVTSATVRRLNLNPLTRWRLSGPVADELLIAPQDLTTADPTLANDLYAGYFSFGGHTVNCQGISPFDVETSAPDWHAALHSFGWLKHLRAADTGVAKTQARVLVDDWIRMNGSYNAATWQVDLTSKRIIAWLCHSPLLLEGCDHTFYRRFMKSLTRQVRFLRLVAKEAPAGMPRLRVAIALAYAAICISGHQSFVKNSMRRLDKELSGQILPDGGHVSRNPRAILDVMALLLPLRQAIIARDVAPGDAMMGAIDRMMPMLRFFRLGDGNFGHFNGMSETPADLLATVLAYDDNATETMLNAPHSGYQRLFAGRTVALVDCGKLPPQPVSGDIHAGCLSFEMSSGTERIVINCGRPGQNALGPDNALWLKLARTTAAHSTLSLNEQSSCRFVQNERVDQLLGTPVLSGPDKVEVNRQLEEGAATVTATHNGYVRPFGLKHQRSLSLAVDGTVLTGRDTLLTSRGKPVESKNKHVFHIRFHLHPLVAAVSSSSRIVELKLASGERWLFSCQGVDANVEESVALSDVFGAKPCLQIVLQGLVGEDSVIDWAFQRLS